MRFGTHPIQIAYEWNTVVHLQEPESEPGKRAFTRAEPVVFFDHADDQVHRIRGHPPARAPGPGTGRCPDARPPRRACSAAPRG
ncbi:hypothetical protein [Nocardiopsis composta]|uniref:Uncharacterized protein n=1 Tax=Nocardiopsis composta TaxID=157465 RepID=A0A7W8VC56_9ACTN|nr:hypothetical protein [Nocardiopsis composta]MBB5430524.1 hypothetical protein [Nocardiopsis composta]